MKQVTARVISNEPVLGELRRSAIRPGSRDILGSWTIWLDCPEIAAEARPGQFVMVRCGGYVLPRPFSIHRYENGKLAIFYAVWEDGKGTGWLAQRRAGDTVDLFGPLGNGFSIFPASRCLCLVAGGIGIAPLHYLAEYALSKGCSVTLLYGTASKDRYPVSLPVNLVAATEDGSVGHRGMVTDLLPDFIGEADQVFACGPLAMYREMTGKYHRLLELKPVQVSLEVRMGCGFGVCYGCTVKTRRGLKQVCCDGPVFDLNEVLWDELVC